MRPSERRDRFVTLRTRRNQVEQFAVAYWPALVEVFATREALLASWQRNLHNALVEAAPEKKARHASGLRNLVDVLIKGMTQNIETTNGAIVRPSHASLVHGRPRVPHQPLGFRPSPQGDVRRPVRREATLHDTRGARSVKIGRSPGTAKTKTVWRGKQRRIVGQS